VQPKPWSFSALERFDTCPKQYHEIVVVKRIKDTEGAAAGYGNFVHEHAEGYLKQPGYQLPVSNPESMNAFPVPAKYKDYFDALLKLPGEHHVEMKMALNKQLQPVEYYAKDVWVRGKGDFVAVDGVLARGVDHKTGKRKPSRQMVLMALLIFYHFPKVEEVRTAFFWLKTNERDTGKYRRADIPAMWNMFLTSLKQYKEAYARDIWQPRQSGLCAGWCPVTDCEFWKPKRPPRR
jgi:hypothetical protein